MIDWYEIRRILWHKVGIDGDAFDELTLPEIAMGLDADFEDKNRSPAAGDILDDDELAEYARIRWTWTVEQKLKAARLGLTPLEIIAAWQGGRL